jgi:hypothetical protein
MELLWDQTGEREFETGVEKGVLYPIASDGSYDKGVAWNGLTAVTESPSGAEVTKKYADNINYLSLISAETFEATIKAYMYPDEWAACDGSATPSPGVTVGQQTRQGFGLSYQTLKGNDTQGQDFGYIIHLVYGGLASPSEKEYDTVNDTPDAIEFSWKISTTPVPVPGLKPSAILKIDSTKVDAGALASLESQLYGQAGTDPTLPSPADVLALFAGSVTVVTATEPDFVEATGVITIPAVTGVQYYRGDTHAALVNGSTVTIPTAGQSLVIEAKAKTGYVLSPTSDDDWSFTRSEA